MGQHTSYRRWVDDVHTYRATSIHQAEQVRLLKDDGWDMFVWIGEVKINDQTDVLFHRCVIYLH